MSALTLKDKFRGSLLGLASGDALGTTLEFRSPGKFFPIDDMIGGGPFNLQPGQWTDDTSMAICLAESLLYCKGLDLRDQCERYLEWWQKGTNSVTGQCFDIGNTVHSALNQYQHTGNPESGPTDSYSAGNGSIMRLAPVPLFYSNCAQVDLLTRCEESSITTHGASESIWRLIGNALHTDKKEAVLNFESIMEFESTRAGEINQNPRLRTL